ncbi:pyruvate dehydrogenase E2 component (dihydrolipoamide acetyltransferase) [Streptomyces sp. 846.5]|nr:dihydrolipoamide acetyltransferase family protein [Streptomyces sp. 846.5]TDT97554.1 pyruvate dehydrogenase E2 component (dihydrolipoamide acetyltransferase) [Streptomyces sp. 846.5]
MESTTLLQDPAEAAFLLPDLGEGLTEAQIVTWLVRVGDSVNTDQPVAEVETAKAVVELPSPFAGRVVGLHGEAGDFIEVGRPLLTVAPEPVRSVAPPAVREAAEGSGQVLVGYGTVQIPAARTGPVRATGVNAASGAVTASPVVRRLAREAGLDLASVAGTGPGGLITRHDVQRAIDSGSPTASTVSPPPAPRPTASLPQPEGERIAIRGALKAAVDQYTLSHREIPAVTIWADADLTELLALRDRLGQPAPSGGGERVGILALLARICVLGLSRFPELNTRVDTEREELVRLPEVHLGLAAQGRRGLVVPVVRDAGRPGLVELAARVRGLVDRARAGQLTADELAGGTFTLNNYGVFGVDGATPLVNPPQAAMLGIGRIVRRPWVVDGPQGEEVVPRDVAQLSLTFDHRVCDGRTAGGFLRMVADLVTRPELMLLHQ